MFREEAIWIKDAIAKLTPYEHHDQAVNIGSSTEHFRKVVQPHIDQNIIQTLQAAAWQVFNVDLKKEAGVDIVADVTNASFATPLKDRFSLTMCTNLLEHVEDISLVVKNLIAITKTNGHILITVPYKYKTHLDPIDNGFRPTPEEILELFKDVAGKIVDSKIISISDVDQYRVKKSKFPVWGYREKIAYYLGKRHKTSGVLFSIKK